MTTLRNINILIFVVSHLPLLLLLIHIVINFCHKTTRDVTLRKERWDIVNIINMIYFQMSSFIVLKYKPSPVFKFSSNLSYGIQIRSLNIVDYGHPNLLKYGKTSPSLITLLFFSSKINLLLKLKKGFLVKPFLYFSDDTRQKSIPTCQLQES